MSRYSLLERLKSEKVLISDGGFGTMMMEKGMEAGETPDLLNLTAPDMIKDIIKEYSLAGADILHTCTFGASPMKLAERGDEGKMQLVNASAVDILKSNWTEDKLISASIGPSGKILQPYGDTPPDELLQGYTEQIKTLYKAGINAITIETMIDIAEAEIAIKAAKAAAPTTPIICTMTFSKTPRGFFTMMGTDIKTACTRLKDAGADIIGSNCGNGIEIMTEIAEEFLANTDLPVIIQSNAGLPEIKNGVLTYPESSEYFAEKAKILVDMGVAIIGGCCGTTPEHIRKIRKLVKGV